MRNCSNSSVPSISSSSSSSSPPQPPSKSIINNYGQRNGSYGRNSLPLFGLIDFIGFCTISEISPYEGSKHTWVIETHTELLITHLMNDIIIRSFQQPRTPLLHIQVVRVSIFQFTPSLLLTAAECSQSILMKYFRQRQMNEKIWRRNVTQNITNSFPSNIFLKKELNFH